MTRLRPLLPFFGLYTFLCGAPAHAEAIPAACLTTHFARERVAAREVLLDGFSARLMETGATLGIAEARITDPTHHLTDAMLRDANTLGALGALLLDDGRTPRSCDTPDAHAAMRSIVQAVVAGGAPELRWDRAVLVRGAHRTTIRSVILRFHPLPGAPAQIGLAIEADGIARSDGGLTPSSVSMSVDLPVRALSQADEGAKSVPLVAPGETLTIHSLHAEYGSSQLDGQGFVRPGQSWQNSSGQLHLEISGMHDLLNGLRGNSPSGVTTALAVAQLMGHRDGDRTGWDVALLDGVLSVNHIPLPLPLH
ncbi:hypothetical protein [Acidomonas methanolica]|uniref:hypothetical protein n=1 Tax=Acidomonas methanolica TaxID=437 RepID=UPI00211A4DF2|nr:hypothetical protein [Acidomonas methanolica]MCQ9154640.1 hypothetical protein [Acidomonas methanolica]